MIKPSEQGDNLFVHWRGKVLTVFYNDLLELLVLLISLTDSQLRQSGFLFQSLNLFGQTLCSCVGQLELLVKVVNSNCRIRSGGLLLFNVGLADDHW